MKEDAGFESLVQKVVTDTGDLSNGVFAVHK